MRGEAPSPGKVRLKSRLAPCGCANLAGHDRAAVPRGKRADVEYHAAIRELHGGGLIRTGEFG